MPGDVELKPCPFCGSPAHLQTIGDGASESEVAWIACTGCDVLMDWNWKESSIATVVASWNRRV